MKMGGHCNRCGYCCSNIAISVGYMRDKDSNYCRYLSWNDELATCEFKTGRTKPEKAYHFFQKYCIRFPRDKSDLDSMKPHCSYTWKDDD